MCIALIAINQHPEYPLIILSNRDEFYKRASAPAHYWSDFPNIFAGKDLIGEGTWLGVNRRGDFGLITNYRDPKDYDPLKRSRGLLVKNYLLETKAPADYTREVSQTADNYNPFNLLVGRLGDIHYLGNEGKQDRLITGVYGISNHLLDTPWFKVNRIKELFFNTLPALALLDQPADCAERLLPILHDRKQASDNRLPYTGVGKDLEKALSPIFIAIPEQAYGTRCSTLILFKRDELFFIEKTFVNSHPESVSITHIPFDLT